FVRDLPDGLDTVVGERGHRLSGGERQRMTIARVLLARPQVVILDEATAHLDSTSEAAVQAALTEALAGRTAVVIAHRLPTIRAADRILVVESGRVVEAGTHRELLDSGGRYTERHDTQFAPAAGAGRWGRRRAAAAPVPGSGDRCAGSPGPTAAMTRQQGPIPRRRRPLPRRCRPLAPVFPTL